MGFLRALVSTPAKVLFVGVLLLLYLEVSLIVMIVRASGEYAHIVLWFELATAIAGGLLIWSSWEKPGFQGQNLPSIGGLLKLWGRVKAICKNVLNYPKLIAGALMIFPGLITDSIGILLVLKTVLFPVAPRLGILDKTLKINDEESSIQTKIKRLLVSHIGTLSKLGSSLAGKSKGILVKIGSKRPNRTSVLSGLRSIPKKLSNIFKLRWATNYLKKKRTDVQ